MIGNGADVNNISFIPGESLVYYNSTSRVKHIFRGLMLNESLSTAVLNWKPEFDTA